jgi:hypothetical protein
MPTAPKAPDQRLLISRADLTRTQMAPDPDAPASRALQDGEARLAVAHFALTSNNITYAAFGEAMKYWQFFPAPDAAWGCLPVWGFATVQESRAEGLAVGRRVWGYLPAGTHLVVQPSRLSATGFACAAPHRQELAAVYNHYSFCDADPAWRPELEALQAVMRPLFITSFLLDDFLADNAFFGAQQLLLSSASSKTAYGTAFCLSLRRGTPGAPRIVGLTSPGNLGFTQALDCYDETRIYDELPTLDPDVPTLYVDFAGNAALRRQVHTHFGDALRFSSSIGGTHWAALGSGGGLPGPRPTLFFAPAQVKKRSAPPPEGWGRAGLEQRIAQAWSAFVTRATDGEHTWVQIVRHSGAGALQAAYAALLQGRGDAQHGLVLSLGTQPVVPPSR